MSWRDNAAIPHDEVVEVDGTDGTNTLSVVASPNSTFLDTGDEKKNTYIYERSYHNQREKANAEMAGWGGVRRR